MDNTKPRKFTANTPEQFAERFWSKVNKGGPVPPHRPELGPCWEWTAYRNPYGYGEVGRRQPRRVDRCHRVAWELEHGHPGDRCVLHACDNPACVRVPHLFLGDRTTNAADKVRKGRQYRGESAATVLTPAVVLQIRGWHASGVSRYRISKRLGLAQSTVASVIQGRTWKHVG